MCFLFSLQLQESPGAVGVQGKKRLNELAHFSAKPCVYRENFRALAPLIAFIASTGSAPKIRLAVFVAGLAWFLSRAFGVCRPQQIELS
jgi:hypothetical protein